MTARDVGGTTDRNSLSACQADGAAMLVEVDAAAVAKLLLVRFIAEGREVVRRLPVAEAARLYYTTTYIHTHIPTEL